MPLFISNRIFIHVIRFVALADFRKWCIPLFACYLWKEWMKENEQEGYIKAPSRLVNLSSIAPSNVELSSKNTCPMSNTCAV